MMHATIQFIGKVMAIGLLFTMNAAIASPSDTSPSSDNVYNTLASHAAEELGLDIRLVKAVIKAESNYDPQALSSAGAIGLMQLMPESGGRAAYKYLYGVDAVPLESSLYKPDVNIWLGTSYLALLYQRFNWIVNAQTRLLTVVAAYNWGPTNVDRHLLNDKTQLEPNALIARIWSRAPLETQQYVRRIVTTLQSQPVFIASAGS